MTAMELAILKAIEERLATIELRLTGIETQVIYSRIYTPEKGIQDVSL